MLGLAASKLSMGSAEGGEEQERAIEQALFRTSTGSSIPHPPSETTAGQPPIMFCSTSSDFVTFRPEKSLRFTCLTIGSRGDVQPYIALCKGLMAEGHKCKIASHGEYRKWVEGHGIAFEEVGGDPAELMQRESFGSALSSNAEFDLSLSMNSDDRPRLLHHLVHEGGGGSLPRLARRPPRDDLEGLSTYRRPHREPERHRRIPHRRGASHPILPVSSSRSTRRRAGADLTLDSQRLHHAVVEDEGLPSRFRCTRPQDGRRLQLHGGLAQLRVDRRRRG